MSKHGNTHCRTLKIFFLTCMIFLVLHMYVHLPTQRDSKDRPPAHTFPLMHSTTFAFPLSIRSSAVITVGTESSLGRLAFPDRSAQSADKTWGESDGLSVSVRATPVNMLFLWDAEIGQRQGRCARFLVPTEIGLSQGRTVGGGYRGSHRRPFRKASSDYSRLI